MVRYKYGEFVGIIFLRLQGRIDLVTIEKKVQFEISLNLCHSRVRHIPEELFYVNRKIVHVDME